MKKLYICGLQGQGKGLLRSLLDGHPEIFSPGVITCPGLALLQTNRFRNFLQHRSTMGNADFLAEPFSPANLRINVHGVVYQISIGYILQYLLKHDFEFTLPNWNYADWSKLFGKPPNDTYRQSEFTLSKFLDSVTTLSLNHEYFHSVEQLQDLIYECFIQNYRSFHAPHQHDSYFLQIPIQNGYHSIEAVEKGNENKKIIVLNRDPISSAFMNAERLVERNLISRQRPSLLDKIFFSPYELTLYSKDYRAKYQSFQSNLNVLVPKTSDIRIMDFSKLISDVESSMNEIAEFLDIQKLPILYYATFDGHPIHHPSGMFQTGRIIHDSDRSLTNKQIQLLNFLFFGWDKNISFFCNVSNKCNSWKLYFWRSRFLNYLRFLYRKLFQQS